MRGVRSTEIDEFARDLAQHYEMAWNARRRVVSEEQAGYFDSARVSSIWGTKRKLIV